MARNRIFRHQSKLMTSIAAYPCLSSILDLLIPAVHAFVVEGKVSQRHSLSLELLADEPVEKGDSLYIAYMKVLDFVGSLTDNSAAKMARELSGVGML